MNTVAPPCGVKDRFLATLVLEVHVVVFLALLLIGVGQSSAAALGHHSLQGNTGNR